MSTFIDRVRCLGRIGVVAIAAGCGSIAYALPLASSGHGMGGGDVRHGMGTAAPALAYGSYAAGSVGLSVGGTMRNGTADMRLKSGPDGGVTVTDEASDETLATGAPASEPGTLGLMLAGLIGVGAIVHRRLRRDD
jgi:hypothetical protein